MKVSLASNETKLKYLRESEKIRALLNEKSKSELGSSLLGSDELVAYDCDSNLGIKCHIQSVSKEKEVQRKALKILSRTVQLGKDVITYYEYFHLLSQMNFPWFYRSELKNLDGMGPFCQNLQNLDTRTYILILLLSDCLVALAGFFFHKHIEDGGIFCMRMWRINPEAFSGTLDRFYYFVFIFFVLNFRELFDIKYQPMRIPKWVMRERESINRKSSEEFFHITC